MSTRRMARLNDQIRADLAELIRKEMKDPRLAGLVSITGVETSPDLRTAKVFVSVLGTPEDAKHSLRALRSGSGFLRSQLAEVMTTRRAPELTFILDDSLERGQRILSLIHEIESDESPTTDAGPTAEPEERRDASS